MDNYPQYQEQQPEPLPTDRPVAVRLPAKKPVVTYVLIGVTVAVYLLQMLSTSLSQDGVDWPFLLGGKINAYILAGELWRLLTPALLHGSLLHIAFNMYALFSLGSSMERYYGHARFLLLYAIGAFCGNSLSFLLSPNPSLGASTAVFGLVAAEGVFIYKNRRLFGSRARGMLTNLALIVAVNLMIGLQPGIDNWGHLGGLAGGALFAWAAGPLLQVQQTYTGYEMTDATGKGRLLWGVLLSAGLFSALVIGKFIAGN
ncbi:MAG TPA: rhomboid family intramembrane serine protease [Anaerolineaceae bacterium]|nr:rhomboid family intramembrane serine protease [Anaerolineaceae bacterium]